MANLRKVLAPALLAGCLSSVWAQQPAAGDRMPQVLPPPHTRALDRFLQTYEPREVTPLQLDNLPRLGQLVRAGNLYLTLADALALSLENNLDVEYERYLPAIARTDVQRAKGGGVTRGFPLLLHQGAPGVGGPASPLLTSVGGASSTSNVLNNASDQSAITDPETNLSMLSTTPLSPGSRLPQYDPVIAGGLSWVKSTVPEPSSFITGTSTLQNKSIVGNLGLTQGFSTGTNVDLAFNSNRTNSNSARNQFNPATTGSLGLTITQPLLQGFNRNVNRRYIRIAENSEKIAAQTLRLQLVATVANVISLYWDLVSLTEDVHVKQQVLDVDTKLYQDNQAQVEQGTLAPIEVKRAQAEVARARQDLTNSTGLLLEEELLLKNVLTRRGTADPIVQNLRIIPLDRIQITPEPERSLQDLIKVAYDSRPDLMEAKLQVDNTRISLTGAREALKPELDLVGTVQNNGLSGPLNPAAPATTVGGVTSQPDPAFVGGYGNFLSQLAGHNYPTYAVGLQLNLPLRNRLAQADYTHDELMLRQAEVRYQQLINQARLEVENALLVLNRARQSYEAAVETRQLQEEALSAEQDRFSVGASTTYMVIQIQRDLAQARSTEVVTLGNYGKAKAQLDRVLGITLRQNGITYAEGASGHITRQPQPLPPASTP
jgi:outer membrane protein